MTSDITFSSSFRNYFTLSNLLALRDITYEVGVKYINRVKAKLINGWNLSHWYMTGSGLGMPAPPPLSLIIKFHVPVMINDIVIIIWEDHVYEQ